jgi:8-oxo-dGTP pyrophosphatase MutT (NUDIX family)
VLLRERDGNLETFLMRRATTMSFGAGMHVFPGGRLEESDVIEGATLTEDDFPFERDARRANATEADFRGLVVCARREVLEETSVRLSFSDVHLFDHWITPVGGRYRFDVRFFVAEVPAGEEPVITGSEADLVLWVRPQFALDEHREDRLPLMRPTLTTLEFLASHRDVASVIEAARTRVIVPIVPRRIDHPDGSVTWSLVNDRTGDTLVDDVPPPNFGLPGGAG